MVRHGGQIQLARLHRFEEVDSPTGGVGLGAQNPVAGAGAQAEAAMHTGVRQVLLGGESGLGGRGHQRGSMGSRGASIIAKVLQFGSLFSLRCSVKLAWQFTGTGLWGFRFAPSATYHTALNHSLLATGQTEQDGFRATGYRGPG